MAGLPTGTVTFLFTDLEGSTRLWEEHPEAMRAALARHDAILRAAVESHRGVVFSETGDGIAAAFASAGDAVAAGLDAQLGLGACEWGETGPLRARMGLHAGEGEVRTDGQYVNQPLNRCARLMAIANGGQVVVSETVETLVRGALPPDVGLVALGEHRLRDLARPIGVFQVTHPALPCDFPPLRSLDELPGNLPVQVTSFVGREEELARVVGELVQERVVTLTGVGGVGKTRLALEVAADIVPEYRDGTWLCELAGVRDPDSVSDAIVAIFGLQPRTGVTATEALLEFLRAKELLLVLDNCEHLLRAVAGLVSEVVRGCPEVRVLATSREGLNVAGERMLGVASLEVPDEAAELEAVALCDAVRLFVDRAQAVKANFALNATNADAVAQVCRRLDGIALAIELAAARVAMLTPGEVARRLDQRFRLLAGGRRTAVERHQTLRAAIDWSYELLSETEQLLLRRLSVFAGGFTLEAAEAVTAGGGIEADDVFELLATLVARSLVVADTEDADTRYRLLETIRQYAQEHLDNSSDGDRARAEHAVYYAGFAEVAIPTLAGPEGIQWERRFEREYDNFRAALTWAVDTQDFDTALRLLGMWDTPMMSTDLSFSFTLRWAAETVLAMPAAIAHPRLPAALVVAAWDAHRQGNHELARRRCDDAVTAERRLGIEPSAAPWMTRVNIALAEGRPDKAVEYARRAVVLCRDRGDSVRLAFALAGSATAHALVGDAAAALPEAEEVVVLTRGFANPSVVRGALGLAAFALGDSQPERALALAREAVELSAASGVETPVWAIAGDLAARQGEHREALEFFTKAIDAFSWLGVRPVLGSLFGRVADLLADDDPEAAAVLLGAGDAFAPGFVQAPHVVEVRRHAVTTLETALGLPRRHELYAQGMVMNEEAAVAYAHAAISRSLGKDPP
jgi:predicted ATPase/class 3 adenylate cyclase